MTRRAFIAIVSKVGIVATGALSLALAGLGPAPAFAQEAQATQGSGCVPPQTDTSYIGPDGTAHVTRVVPVPATISPEAQKFLARVVADAPDSKTLEEWRAGTDAWQKRAGAESLDLYPVKIAEGKIAGVPVRVVTPETGEAEDFTWTRGR